MISGVTDCYQPAERKFRMTRGILEVLLEARQACGVITKNALVVRDLDLLAPLAEMRLIRVMLSVTTLDHELARSAGAAHLAARQKARGNSRACSGRCAGRRHGRPDHPRPDRQRIAQGPGRGRRGGRKVAGYVMLRLPFAVRPIFEDWLARNRPEHYDRVISRIRSTRGGQMYQTEWRVRQTGTGEYAEQIAATFKVFKKKYGLDGDLPPQDFSLFRPPRTAAGQLRLF